MNELTCSLSEPEANSNATAIIIRSFVPNCVERLSYFYDDEIPQNALKWYYVTNAST